MKSTVTVDVTNINVSAYFCDVMKDFYFATSRSQNSGVSPFISALFNIPDTEKETALHNAAFLDIVEIIKSLLVEGMSVDLTNAEDSMPLHFSALIGGLEATKALCKIGAPLMSVPVSFR